MVGKYSILLLAIAVVAALMVVSLPGGARASPSIEDGINMAEAIRYLEKLDKYYSQIARPRYYAPENSHLKLTGDEDVSEYGDVMQGKMLYCRCIA